ncbi:MAG TPA: zinc ribbon domain-containing protein, partial [Ktedonobacteraceae bacterium]
MKCQNCGNELGQDEVFCGQCGAPNAMPAQPTEMMQAPVSRSGLLSDAYRNRTGNAFSPNQSNLGLSPDNVPGPGQSAIRPSQSQSQPQQVGGFYQDATEAISFVPGTPTNNPQGSYPQQGFAGGSMAGSYPGSSQFGSQVQPQAQQFLSGNSFTNTNFPPTQASFPNGQPLPVGYRSESGISTLQPASRRVNAAMVAG